MHIFKTNFGLTQHAQSAGPALQLPATGTYNVGKAPCSFAQCHAAIQHDVLHVGPGSKEACTGPNKVALTTAMTSSARQLSLRCLGSCKQSTTQQLCPMFTPLHPPSVQKVHSVQSDYALQAQILHDYSAPAMKHG